MLCQRMRQTFPAIFEFSLCLYLAADGCFYARKHNNIEIGDETVNSEQTGI